MRSGLNPVRSTGAPARLIQYTVNPYDFAPIASQQFEDTKPMCFVPSLFTASSRPAARA